MAAPLITITSISKTKISDEPGYDQTVVKFTANQILKDYIAKADGSGYTNGIVVGQSTNVYPSETLYPSIALYPQDYALIVGSEQQFEVDNKELGIDGTYRINVYGMNELGEWTTYE